MSDISQLIAAAISAGVPIVIDNRSVHITINGGVHIHEPKQPDAIPDFGVESLPRHARSTIVNRAEAAEADRKTAMWYHDTALRAKWDAEANERWRKANHVSPWADNIYDIY